MTPAEIGSCGERHVTTALTNEGWKCYQNTQQQSSTDITATSNNQGILVQVKTGLSPNPAPDLSAEEKRAIVGRASQLNYVAYLAQLQIKTDRSLVGSIQWTKLT